MKKKYFNLELSIYCLDKQDVIRTSIAVETDNVSSWNDKWNFSA